MGRKALRVLSSVNKRSFRKNKTITNILFGLPHHYSKSYLDIIAHWKKIRISLELEGALLMWSGSVR